MCFGDECDWRLCSDGCVHCFVEHHLYGHVKFYITVMSSFGDDGGFECSDGVLKMVQVL